MRLFQPGVQPHVRSLAAATASVTLAALGFGLSPLAAAQQDNDQALDEIVVTGSYIRRSTADSASPLTVLDRMSIEQQGTIEITDLIARMPYNSGSTNATNAFSGDDASNGSGNFNLRNLGLGSTLVLLNGRRHVAQNVDAGGNAYVDVASLVPTIAIERVEVIKDGASALYGSDAVAGVVNLLTRKNFEGMELSVDYRADQATWDQRDRTYSGIWGFGNDDGHLVLSAEFLHRAGQKMGDREDDFGGSVPSVLGRSYIPQNALLIGTIVPGAPIPNIADADCELAGEVYGTAFPSPLTGQSPNALEALGGCMYDATSHYPVVGDEQRFLANATGHYNISDNVEFYGSVGFSDQDWSRENSLYPIVRFPTVPTHNPGYEEQLGRWGVTPAQAGPARLYSRLLGGGADTPFELRPYDTDSRIYRNDMRVVTGLRGDLPALGDSWTFDTAFTYSERETDARHPETRQQQVSMALQGFGGPDCDPISGTAGSGNQQAGDCYYWNPFFSGLIDQNGDRQTDPTLANPDELIQWMAGEIRTTTRSQQHVVDAVITGDLLELPNGLPMSIAVGGQMRRDEQTVDADSDSNNNNYVFIYGAPDWSAKETVWAGFVELLLPVSNRLEFQAAARYETFEELDDNSFDPKLTALFNATDDLTLRGSIGTSFRTGSLVQRAGSTTQLLNFADAFAAEGEAFRPAITSGNPDLKPEEAFTWNLGLSWAPSNGALDGLSVDMDYYFFDYDDLITRENEVTLVQRDAALRCPQGLNDANDSDYDPSIPACGPQTGGSTISIGEGIPDVVIRDENLNFLRLEPTYVNAQSLKTDGLDFDVNYRFDVENAGNLTAGLQGTWTRRYDLTLPDGTTFDGVGKRNASNSIGRSLPEVKFNASLSWMKDRHSAFLMARYIDSYKDDQANPGTLRAELLGLDLDDRSISSWTTWDLQYSYDVPEAGFLPGASRITLGGINIFDKRPPKVNTDMGFDPTLHDARGAIWYAKLAVDL